MAMAEAGGEELRAMAMAEAGGDGFEFLSDPVRRYVLLPALFVSGVGRCQISRPPNPCWTAKATKLWYSWPLDPALVMGDALTVKIFFMASLMETALCLGRTH